jgi:hypothetical protein
MMKFVLLVLLSLQISCQLAGDNISFKSSVEDSSKELAVASEVVKAKGSNQQKAENEMTFIGAIREIDKEYPFYMTITQNGENLSGTYFYFRSKDRQKLRLEGKINKNNEFSLTEIDPNGIKTAEFKGQLKEEEGGIAISGDWISRKNKKKLEFYAKRQMLYFKTNVEIKPLAIIEKNNQRKYDIQVLYPQIVGIENEQSFNKMIKEFIENLVKEFKSLTEEPVKGYPGISNILGVDYTFTYADENVISIVFSVYEYFIGAAHGNVGYRCMNFNVKTGRELRVQDVFKSDDYLRRISEYCTKKLKEKLEDNLFVEGLEPKEENYEDWAVTKMGLLFIFPPYQVASYADGTQEVLIPYKELEDLFRKEDNPIVKIYK